MRYAGYPFRVVVLCLALCLIAAPSPAATLVAPGATWSYNDTGTDLGTAWRAPDYDDSGWAEGPAELGYGDGDEATVLSYGSDPNNKFPCYYFRHRFPVADPSVIQELTLRIVRDDGCVVYLNGTEIARSNMPAGEILYTTWASGVVGGDDESAWNAFSVVPALLVSGENVLAAEIHQPHGTSSDISFNLELEKVAPTPTCTLDSPLDQAVINSTTVSFACSAGDAIGLTQATLYLREASQPDLQPIETKALSGTADTVTFDVSGLVSLETYVWNCLVENNSGEQSWAPADGTFTVDVDSPNIPALVGPADGASGVSLSAVLNVQVDDPNGDALEVTFYGCGISTVDDFTLVVLPDTQKYVLDAGTAQIFTAQTQWIVNNMAARNIVFVSHEGDIVDTVNDTVQWDRSRYSMSLLDGVVPYGVAPGNHDLVVDTHDTTYFDQYFPYTAYSGLPWYGGHYPSDSNANSYQLFSAGGEDYIIVHLEYYPTAADIAWANSVLQANADRKAMITTHAYMNTSGVRYTASYSIDFEYIWTDLVVPNSNVFFVLCGHESGEYTRSDVVGNRVVHQLLADFQGRANGGDGWLRIMRFSPAEDTVYVQTYSPWRQEYETDANSEFSLDFPMDVFSVVGVQTNVPSGSNASVAWSNLSPNTEYSWYATVRDPSGKTTVGPLWTFTTGSGDTDPPAISNVLAVNVSDNEAGITWTTDEAADSLVEYGLDVSYGSQASDPALVTGHAITLSGLLPETVYHYRVTSEDSSGNAASSLDYTFTTLPGNHPPDAVDDASATDEDVPVLIDLTGNDTDPDPGDVLAVSSITDPPNGAVINHGNGTATYTPDPDFFGTDSFTYTIDDGHGGTDSANVTVTVDPVNDPPVANDDTATVVEDGGPITIAVLSNDSIAPDVGESLSITAVTQGSIGGVELTGGGTTLEYTPSMNAFGADSFGYTVSDGNGGTANATVSVTVTPVNDPPIALADNYAIDEDNTLNVDAGSGVLANDGDVENDALSAVLVAVAGNGSVSLNADGSFTYTPDPDFNGTDAFSYEANDGSDPSNAVQVTITVNAVNDAPVAADDSYSVNQDGTLNVGAPGVLENDTDAEGSALTAAKSADPAHGTLTLNGNGSFEYTPDTGYAGTDSFTYVANDGTYNSAPATVNITIVPDTANDAYVSQDPLIVFGGLAEGSAGIEGTTTAGDGVTQDITEGPNGRAGAASLDVQYTLHTLADPAEVSFLELYVDAAWVPGEAADPLVVLIWNGSGWQDITNDIVSTGKFVPAGNPADYVGAQGDILVRFTDTAPVRQETKDTLTVDLLYARIAAGPADTEPPAPPTGLTATAQGLDADLQWTANGESDLAGYRVYRSTVSGSGYQEVTQSPIGGTSFLDPVGAEGTYYYVVTAVDQYGNESQNSSEASVDLVDTPPAAPTGLQAVADLGEVALSWAANTDSDLAGYWVYRSEDGQSGTYSRINGALLSTPGYLDGNVSNGTEYWYYVTAEDVGGHESMPSASVSAIPTDAPPAPPTGLQATPGDGRVSLDWDDNTESDLLHYEVRRATTSGGSYTVTFIATNSEYVDTTAANGTEYFYVVRAVDTALKTSGDSEEVSATPQAPQFLHVAAITMDLVLDKKTYSTALVQIVDQSGAPIVNATVVGDWYFRGRVIAQGDAASTDSNGDALLASPSMNVKSGDVFEFVVSDVVFSGYTYDAGQNIVSQASIAVP